MDKVFLTKKGLKSIKTDLAELEDKKRPKLIKRLSRARAMGDLSENAEYASAREELSLIDGRIEELRTILSKAKLIRKNNKKGKKTAVALGCKVTVRVNGKTYIYEVVGEWEADPINKKISHNSPLGKALLGRKIGEEVEIEAPAGKVIYSIKKIE